MTNETTGGCVRKGSISELIDTNDRRAKERMLGELFDQIDDARTKAARLRREADAAEARVDNLLADARILMLTD